MSLSEEYLVLFRAAADAEERAAAIIRELEALRQGLIRAQQQAEELYLSAEEEKK